MRVHAPAHTPTPVRDSCSLPPSLPSSLARKSTYRRPRERIIREEGGRNRWRDHVEIRVLCDATTAIPCAEFLACVRKCLGGILRYCHRIFSRNPLRSCLGPWTHTRVTFIPFFVSRPLNRTPLLPPLLPLLLTKFGWQGGIRRRSVAGSSFVSFERSNFYRRCAIRDGESKLSGYFFFLLPSSPSPPTYLLLLLPRPPPQISLDLSESWNRIGERRFSVNFYHLCPRSTGW